MVKKLTEDNKGARFKELTKRRIEGTMSFKGLERESSQR